MYERFRPFTEISQDGRGLPSFFRLTHTPCRLIRRQPYSLWRRANSWKLSLSSWRRFFLQLRRDLEDKSAFRSFYTMSIKPNFCVSLSATVSLETNPFYPASRGFSLAWLLAFTKSFTWLVCRVVALFTPNLCKRETCARRVTTSFILRSCVTKFYNNSYRKNYHQIE